MTDIAKVVGIAIASVAKVMGHAGAKVMGLAWPTGGGWEQPVEIDGVLGWYAASDITGKNDGDPVHPWEDLTGNGHDFVQATSGSRPLYKTNIINGHPALLFDGSDDCMLSDLIEGIGTVVIVAIHPDELFSWYEGLISGASSYGWFVGQHGYDHFYPTGDATTYMDGDYGADPATQTWHVFLGLTAGHLDTAVYIGEDRGLWRLWTGYIAEVVIFNNILSSGDQIIITDYLMEKYGIV
jgi:hypothetical protein